MMSDIPMYEPQQDRRLLEQAREAAAATIDRYSLKADNWPDPLLDALARKMAPGLKAHGAKAGF